MSVNFKILSVMIFLMVFPLHEQKKDKCLIIYLKDNKKLYQITNPNKGSYYLILKYPDTAQEENQKVNPALQTGVPINANSNSYSLKNRQKIDSLPISIKPCNCGSVGSFNLGKKFKVYVQKVNGWVVFDAEDSLVWE